MKKAKFTHLMIVSSIFFTFTNIFIFHPSPVYSKDNSTEPTDTENSDFNCYRKYPETKYPEAKFYCYGIANTKIAEENKKWNYLTAITKDNTKIIWENNKVNSRLLVVTWTGWDGYKKIVNKDSEPISQDVWVTVAPELKEFCKQVAVSKDITLSYRMNQLLGLAPEDSDKNKRRNIVEFWVEPRDLFRPTPDPEITDHKAELDFPQFSWLMSISDYKYWFLNQLMTNSYPWTKLGYTYDWGKQGDWEKIDQNRPINVGLSEFIIRKNALVKVVSVTPPEDYCKKI